jgi:hypothetical protein
MGFRDGKRAFASHIRGMPIRLSILLAAALLAAAIVLVFRDELHARGDPAAIKAHHPDGPPGDPRPWPGSQPEVGRELGILTIGVVTKPFHFEGQRRMRFAETGIAELLKVVDTLLIIPNQNLFRVANEAATGAW